MPGSGETVVDYVSGTPASGATVCLQTLRLVSREKKPCVGTQTAISVLCGPVNVTWATPRNLLLISQ